MLSNGLNALRGNDGGTDEGKDLVVQSRLALRRSFWSFITPLFGFYACLYVCDGLLEGFTNDLHSVVLEPSIKGKLRGGIRNADMDGRWK